MRFLMNDKAEQKWGTKQSMRRPRRTREESGGENGGSRLTAVRERAATGVSPGQTDSSLLEMIPRQNLGDWLGRKNKKGGSGKVVWKAFQIKRRWDRTLRGSRTGVRKTLVWGGHNFKEEGQRTGGGKKRVEKKKCWRKKGWPQSP